MDIIFSANNNETVLVLPVLPPEMPELVQPYKNTTFETVNGEINLIGTKGLRTVSIQSFFPLNKNYPFLRPGSEKDGWKYVEFFNKYANLRVPIRMIFVDNLSEISNMAYTIENFACNVTGHGTINYTLDLKEYRFIDVKKVI